MWTLTKRLPSAWTLRDWILLLRCSWVPTGQCGETLPLQVRTSSPSNNKSTRNRRSIRSTACMITHSPESLVMSLTGVECVGTSVPAFITHASTTPPSNLAKSPSLSVIVTLSALEHSRISVLNPFHRFIVFPPSRAYSDFHSPPISLVSGPFSQMFPSLPQVEVVFRRPSSFHTVPNSLRTR